MSNFIRFKTNYCVGGTHYKGTNNIRGVVTAKGTKMLKDNCTKCRRNKSMKVSDATIGAERLKDFLKSAVRATVNFGKKVANNPSRNPRAALSATLDLINFAITGECISVVQKGRGLYLGTKKR